MLLVSILTGLPNGAAAPLFYEFAAQITFPISEGSSASALSLFENFGALALYEVIARVMGPPWVNVVFTAGMACCCLGLSFVKEEYRKRDAEDDMTDSIITRMSEQSAPDDYPGSVGVRPSALPGNALILEDGSFYVRRVQPGRPTEDTPLLRCQPNRGIPGGFSI